MKNTTIKELKYLAFHDILTGLNNRSYLYKKVNLDNYNYIYFIDLNRMHEINKKGHLFGDRHIKECVKIVSKLLNKNSLFIRYAGDEFIVLSKSNINIKSNKEYAVGKVKKLSNNLLKEIERADKLMLIKKNLK